MSLGGCGVRACQLGYKTKFYTVTQLVLKLAEARKNGTLERLLMEKREHLKQCLYIFVQIDNTQYKVTLLTPESYTIKKALGTAQSHSPRSSYLLYLYSSIIALISSSE